MVAQGVQVRRVFQVATDDLDMMVHKVQRWMELKAVKVRKVCVATEEKEVIVDVEVAPDHKESAMAHRAFLVRKVCVVQESVHKVCRGSKAQASISMNSSNLLIKSFPI